MARFPRSLPLLLATALAVCPGAAAPPKKKAVTRIVPKATPAPATPPVAPGELPLWATGAIVIDAYTGQPLYEKNADTPLYPASTTKIMTALLVIEAGDLDGTIECTLEDSKVGESSLSLKPGQRYTRRQMLYGLMLKSANDVAHALGRDNAGSAEAFADKMSLRAAELGAKNTSFKNANGLHHKEHFTTARDLAIITRAAMQQPVFRKIVATRAFMWPTETGALELSNHNRLLKEFPGCTGVKTGYTRPAQHTLVTAALRGGREVISAVLYATRQGKWDDSILLMSYGFEKLAERADLPTAGN